MSIKAKVEAIIYATEEPVTLNQLASLLKDAVLAELRAEEEARLALNQTVSDGKPLLDDEDSADILNDDAEPPAEPELQPQDIEGNTVASEDLGKEQLDDRNKQDLKQVREYLGQVLDDLISEYSEANRGMEVRQIAGGYRMATKPEHHDVVVTFAKSLKPPIRLSLQALETLAVIAYKQPVTVPEISEIRGVDSSGVIATLLDRKLITTGGRKQVIGRPILYKTTKEFLLRFGLNNVAELPSMEEFEKLGDPQAGLFEQATSEAASDTQTPASETKSVVSGGDEPAIEADAEAATSPDETPLNASTPDYNAK
jgi:segregation and condensation protein B